MASTLTAAGIKLCIALSGHDLAFIPTVEVCDRLLWPSMMLVDRWGRSPVSRASCPNGLEKNTFCQPPGYRCIAIETYDIYDGSKGSTWWCTRSATLKWTDEGQSYWDFKE